MAMTINDLGEPIEAKDLDLGEKCILVRHVREPDGLPTTPISDTLIFYGWKHSSEVMLINGWCAGKCCRRRKARWAMKLASLWPFGSFPHGGRFRRKWCHLAKSRSQDKFIRLRVVYKASPELPLRSPYPPQVVLMVFQCLQAIGVEPWKHC